MFDQHLKLIKIHFSIITFIVIATMSVGALYLSNIFHTNTFYFYFTSNYIQKKTSALQYKYEIARAHKRPLQALFTLVKSEQTIDTAEAKSKKLFSLPVLVYHGIIPKPDGSNVLFENFKKQMFTLYNAGYTTVTLEEANAFLRGERELPEKSFLLTFDDGRKDSYYPVDPILEAMNYTAVIFVITSHSLIESENNYYLTLGELKQMKNSGRWDIGAHAHKGHDFETIDKEGQLGHFFGNKLWIEKEGRIETDEEFKNRIETEMKTIKEELHKKLDINAIGIAYPFGDYGQESLNYPLAKNVVLDVSSDLYTLAFYQVPSEPTDEKRNYPSKDTFLVKRIEVKPDWKQEDLLQILTLTEDKTLPFSDNFGEQKGWKNVWGDVSFSKDGLFLSATASTTGSMSILDGGYLWTDYLFRTEVEPLAGQTYTLIARYRDGNNSVSCKYGPDRVTLEKKVNGNVQVLHVWKDNKLPRGKIAHLGMGVEENTVRCMIENTILEKENTLDENSNRGSVGFSIWDPNFGVSKMKVKNIEVHKL